MNSHQRRKLKRYLDRLDRKPINWYTIEPYISALRQVGKVQQFMADEIIKLCKLENHYDHRNTRPAPHATD